MKNLLKDLNGLEMKVKDTLGKIKDNFKTLECEQTKIDLAVMDVKKTIIDDELKEEVVRLIKLGFNTKLGLEDIYNSLQSVLDRLDGYALGKQEIVLLKEVPYSKLKELNDICNKMNRTIKVCRGLNLDNIVIYLETMAQVLEEFNDSIDELYK